MSPCPQCARGLSRGSRLCLQSAATGVAGLTALKKKPADAVLLDIAMPGALGGLETLRAIRGSWPALPVIIVTANADEAIAKTTLREEAFDYVMRPPALVPAAGRRP
jgi:CheY-like chemotaxis protein